MKETHAKGHCMCNTKLWNISGPERLEMIGEADLASTVHLGCFAIKLRQGYLWCCSWICDWNLQTKVGQMNKTLLV